MAIPFVNLAAQYQRYKADIDQRMQAVIDTTAFIMGPAVKELERDLTAFTGSHAVACGSGTDALLLALMAIDIQPGDEVITTPFTFIATGEIIALLKAKPVFVDIDPVTYNIDAEKIAEKVTKKTKAIMPVSLYGQPAAMQMINQIADMATAEYGHRVYVIEDAAQSFGATYQGKASGNLSTIACTSFFPAKPLGCYGDGGACFSQDETLAEKMRILAVHGSAKRYYHEYLGVNARMDTIQAAVLNAKLPHYRNEVAERQAVAERYDELLKDVDGIVLPQIMSDRTSVWAQYTLRVPGQRDALMAALKDKGVPTAVHYPRPLTQQPCFQDQGYKLGDFPISEQAALEVMSLPMCAFTKAEDQAYIADAIKSSIIETV